MTAHGQQLVREGWNITILDALIALGHPSNVSAMYGARRLGASIVDECLVFYENGHRPACYRHLDCDCIPVVERVHAEREAVHSG